MSEFDFLDRGRVRRRQRGAATAGGEARGSTGQPSRPVEADDSARATATDAETGTAPGEPTLGEVTHQPAVAVQQATQEETPQGSERPRRGPAPRSGRRHDPTKQQISAWIDRRVKMTFDDRRRQEAREGHPTAPLDRGTYPSGATVIREQSDVLESLMDFYAQHGDPWLLLLEEQSPTDPGAQEGVPGALSGNVPGAR